MDRLQRFYVHVDDARHHLVQISDVLSADGPLVAHLVDEARDYPYHAGARLSRVLFFEAGLGVRAVAFCNTLKGFRLK